MSYISYNPVSSRCMSCHRIALHSNHQFHSSSFRWIALHFVSLCFISFRTCVLVSAAGKGFGGLAGIGGCLLGGAGSGGAG
eukprot:scaffold6044_cov29-Prasinocladus_malaysianus.AAC.1